MVHEWIGQLGHLLTLVSFTSVILAAFSWFAHVQTTKDGLLASAPQSWLKLARASFWVHIISVMGVVGSLFFIIYNHYFEYHYAWSHSSLALPVHYMISCFWEGQEGSFLLWIFWHAILGAILLQVSGKWEPRVMAIFASVQAFLASMIMGIVIPGLELKIGSSPFMLMRDVMNLPVFAINPDYVPADGTGLNPLLQNYWMVIHPPTLFLGFALVIVPFCYCLAALWKKEPGSWVKPAMPWTGAATLVLGVGILMGAYWAYETLNFGGYWNWDPVENAVYVPWLTLVGSMHLMIVYRKNGTALRAGVILMITTFLLVLYSTFLTRSGILGNSSVHSFTDLGLSGQLLIYLLAFTILSIVLLAVRWKYLPAGPDPSVYSREFWIFIGVTILGLMAFQVIIPTSIPVYNKLAELVGIELNMAPPTDPVAFYTNFQLWFAVALALVSGTAQFFWWQKMDAHRLWQAIAVPLVVSLILSAIIIVINSMHQVPFIALTIAATYAIVSNSFIIFSLKQNNLKLSGGAISHIGVALILLGILFSSGFDKVISLNNSGLLYSREFADEVNRENILLWQNQPQDMNDYKVEYKGKFVEPKNLSGYIDKRLLMPTGSPQYYLARSDYYRSGQKVFSQGDSVEVLPENTYYRVEYTKEDGAKFVLYPRAQVNPQMGFIASPDIQRTLDRDLYTHVSVVPDESEPAEWSAAEEVRVAVGKQFFINDYVATLEGLEQSPSVPGMKLGKDEIAAKIKIKVMGDGQEYTAEPYFIINTTEGTGGTIAAVINDLAIKIGVTTIHPDDNSVTLTTSTSQKEYIVLKAMEKPLINVLWLGTVLLILGFCVAIYRRWREYKLVQGRNN